LELGKYEVDVLLSAPAVLEGLQALLQRNLCVRLRCQQWAEAASRVVGRQVLELELWFCDVLLVGDVWAGLDGRLCQSACPTTSQRGIAYLLSARAQTLHDASVLVQAGVGLLKQAVDDINNPPPIGVYRVDVGQLGTYSVRTRCSIFEKALREVKEARILGVELGADGRVERPLEPYVGRAYV
jgi:hypothetical protein